MTKLYLAVVFYIHLESSVFLLMYNVQDSIGPDNVFYTIHTLYAVFDLFIVVCAFSSERNCIPQQLQCLVGALWSPLLESCRPPCCMYHQVLVPFFLLYKSLTNHPEVWTNFEPR